MASFDEKSGVISCNTPWGRWWQTVEDVQIEIKCPDKTLSKQIRCNITATSISCYVNGMKIIEGRLAGTVKSDDSLWSLEDRKLVRILLAKARPGADNCWESLLACSESSECYPLDAWTLNEIQKKLTLERFQNEVHQGLRSLDHDDDLDD